MRATVTTVILTLAAGAAWAHPGHVQEAAGHDHWVALAAAGAALALGGLAALGGARALRSRRDERQRREETRREEAGA